MASRFDFEAIGTHWQIDIYDPLSKNEEAVLFAAIKQRIDQFDQTYSRFRDDSLVTEISKRVDTYILPDDAKEMMHLYKALYDQTGGLMTPLIGQMLVDAGYDADYSLIQKKELENAPLWDECLVYEHPMLIVKKAVLLDFGALGKGYLIDLVGEVIEAHEINSYCIDAGGDILSKNNQPMRIGLENPANDQEVIGVATITNESICGSAGNRRKWGNFTHIINPVERSSQTNIEAVWVVAATARYADALTTALYFSDPLLLKKNYPFEYCIVYADSSVAVSDNFPGELFTQ